MATYPMTHQPGKPPFLLHASPAGISSFVRSARLYFRKAKVDTDEDKISYLGEGLTAFPELYNWYNASAELHEAKEYKTFVADLQKKALPRDYVWETKGRIRRAKQDGHDYEDWSTAMRTEHLALTEAVMSTKDFVECLLYGMDPELSVVLRNGVALKNSGFHQDDMANLAFPSTTPPCYATTVDYAEFDAEARNEWAKIASRRSANAAQLKSINKKVTSSSTSATVPSRSPSTSKDSTSVSKGSNNGTSSGAVKTAKLTELEKDWLRATNGCFKCRESWVDHESARCGKWPPAGYVVPVPPGWDSSKEVPVSLRPRPSSSAATSGTTAPVIGVRALHIYDSDSEIDLPESLAQDSDTDTDE